MIHVSQVAANPLVNVFYEFRSWQLSECELYVGVKLSLCDPSARLTIESEALIGSDKKAIAKWNNESKYSQGVIWRFDLAFVIDATSFEIDWNSISLISENVHSKLLRSV